MKENVNCCLHKFTSLVESEHFQYQPTVNIHVSCMCGWIYFRWENMRFQYFSVIEDKYIYSNFIENKWK